LRWTTLHTDMAQSVPSRHPSKPKRFVARKTDEQRKSSSQRGYNEAWAAYSKRLREERIFCELCIAAFGIETPIVGQTTTDGGRKKSQGVTDHIIPVASAEDDLFWMPENHWCTCRECDDWKSRTFDGSLNAPKRYVTDRTLHGIESRRREIIEERMRTELKPLT